MFERCEKCGVNAELILMAGILIGAIVTIFIMAWPFCHCPVEWGYCSCP